jgi:hypothetical protein
MKHAFFRPCLSRSSGFHPHSPLPSGCAPILLPFRPKRRAIPHFPAHSGQKDFVFLQKRFESPGIRH